VKGLDPEKVDLEQLVACSLRLHRWIAGPPMIARPSGWRRLGGSSSGGVLLSRTRWVDGG